MHRRALVVLLPVLLLPGCAEARDAAGTVGDCASLARDVAQSGLASTPTQAEAEEAVRQLDERVDGLDDVEIRDAAADLRDRFRELQEVARSADPAAVRQATGSARDAARRTAEACGLPADAFVQ